MNSILIMSTRLLLMVNAQQKEVTIQNLFWLNVKLSTPTKRGALAILIALIMSLIQVTINSILTRLQGQPLERSLMGPLMLLWVDTRSRNATTYVITKMDALESTTDRTPKNVSGPERVIRHFLTMSIKCITIISKIPAPLLTPAWTTELTLQSILLLDVWRINQ